MSHLTRFSFLFYNKYSSVVVSYCCTFIISRSKGCIGYGLGGLGMELGSGYLTVGVVAEVNALQTAY
jgi:hypothetical protein